MDRTAGGYPADPSAFGYRCGRLARIARRNRRTWSAEAINGAGQLRLPMAVATLKKARAPETGPCGRKNMHAAMPDFASGEFNQLDG
jgi:hypothetical protein